MGSSSKVENDSHLQPPFEQLLYSPFGKELPDRAQGASTCSAYMALNNATMAPTSGGKKERKQAEKESLT